MLFTHQTNKRFKGMTVEEMKVKYAREFECREMDMLSYRYPRGESYLDVIQRLEPLIQEIERHKESLLIVGHEVPTLIWFDLVGLLIG